MTDLDSKDDIGKTILLFILMHFIPFPLFFPQSFPSLLRFCVCLHKLICLRAKRKFLTKSSSWFQARATYHVLCIFASGTDGQSFPTRSSEHMYIHTPTHTAIHIFTHKHTYVVVQMIWLIYSDVKTPGFRTFSRSHKEDMI